MAVRISFSGHETFPLRFNWPKKAYDAAARDSEIFGKDEAIAELGVGKNMVRAIRHWGLACGILDDDETTAGSYVETEFGTSIFGEEGFDPFLEDEATAWLLHWKLCGDLSPAPLWHYVFGCWRGRALDPLTVFSALDTWAEQRGVHLPSRSTLKRDLQCLLATYTPRRTSRGHLEDALGSPLSNLGLVRETDGVHQLQQGTQRTLPAHVFGYAVLDHWERAASGQGTLPLRAVLHEEASPGRVFRLSENYAFDLLTEIERLEHPPFEYRDTAGSRQLYRTDAEVTGNDLLQAYYGATAEAAGSAKTEAPLPQ